MAQIKKLEHQMSRVALYHLLVIFLVKVFWKKVSIGKATVKS